jgi:hypothetical protein
VPFNADPACFGPYTKVPDDPDLRVSTGQGASKYAANYDPAAPSDWRRDNAVHGAFGAGAAAWYLLPPGRGLATAPPGRCHCGTNIAGWLSGWSGAAGTAPGDDQYAVPADGALPPAAGLPPADGVVCFDYGIYAARTCYKPKVVRAVGCGAFDLWSLPPLHQGIQGAYCLAA